MNVLVMHPSLNAGGGSERLCLTLIESLKERGYNVTLGTFEKTRWKYVENLFGDVLKPDMEIVKPRLFGYSAYGELMNFHRLLSATSKNYDITIVSCTSPWFYCPATKRAIVYMIPPVSYCLNITKKVYLTPYISIQQRLIKKAWRKVFLTNSLFSRKIIEEVYGIQCEVLYPPVDVERFFASSKKENLIVSLGRFDSFKRFEILIKAFAQVESGKCSIIGSTYRYTSNKYLTKLKRLIRDLRLNHKIELIVNPPFNVIQEILSKAKIYVHSAQFEHFGISVVEAMASGCVPIAHKYGGPYSDILAYGKYGFSFVNVSDLANKIEVLLKDENLYKRFREKALKRSKNFERKNFKEKIIDIVSEICKS